MGSGWENVMAPSSKHLVKCPVGLSWGFSCLGPEFRGLSRLEGCQRLSYVALGQGHSPQLLTSRTSASWEIHLPHSPDSQHPTLPSWDSPCDPYGIQDRLSCMVLGQVPFFFFFKARLMQSPPFTKPSLGLFRHDNSSVLSLMTPWDPTTTQRSKGTLWVVASFCVSRDFCWVTSDLACT